MDGSRIPSRRDYGEPIAEAFDRLPPTIAHRLNHVRFVCGADPIFAGLHRYETTADGRSYRTEPHCCYRTHLVGPADRRVTTIVLPQPAPVWIIVHELGHALHETINFSHVAEPVTEYARTNHHESFAEAFVAWRYWYGDQDAAARDRATLRLFETLAT